MKPILECTLDLIEEAEQQQEAPQPPQPPKQPPQSEEEPPPPKVKVPSKIKSFINKMIKDFGPDGNASMDMKFMRKARETLGITGGKVSKVIDKIEAGASPEEVIADIKSNTDKF